MPALPLTSGMRRAATTLAAASVAIAAPARAQYSTVSLSTVTNNDYCTVGLNNCTSFPGPGAQTFNGIPFQLLGNSSNALLGWFGVTAAGGGSGTVSVTVPVNVFGVTNVYSLLNTFWGQAGPNSYASVTFTGSGGASFTQNLVGGSDIRDYNSLTWTNTINGTTTTQVFTNNLGQRLDEQVFTLPTAFAAQTLQSVTFTDQGNQTFQRLMLTGLTVRAAQSTVPEPSTWALLAAGLGAVGAVTRRRTRA